MLHSQQQWMALADSFYEAATEGSGWSSALQQLADATGSRTGELIGVGADGAVLFNLMTNVDPAFHEEFVAQDGGNPAHNPRVRAGMSHGVMQALTEADFITPEEYRRDPHYQGLSRTYDLAWSCLMTLERNAERLTGLAVLRSAKQGHISEREKQVFTSLGPHIRVAVRLQQTLQQQGAQLLAGALEALALPAFICDRAGRVKGMTAAAETLLCEDTGLSLRDQRLLAANPAESRQLEVLIAHAAADPLPGRPPLAGTVLLTGNRNTVLDVFGMRTQGELDLNFMPRVLVVARNGARDDAHRRMILQAAYGLSAAETEVALGIASGMSAERIALARGVSPSTVRVQIKSVFNKLGVNRQVELAARIAAL